MSVYLLLSILLYVDYLYLQYLIVISLPKNNAFRGFLFQKNFNFT